MKPAVLVTRTAPGGEALARRLAGAGWKVLYGPPIRLDGPADPVQTSARLRELLPADRVVMTSARAVEEAVRLAPPALLAAGDLIVPGPGTAATARRLGLDSVCHPRTGGTSEAMLELPSLRQVAGLRVVLLAASGGRRHLGEELVRRGARVDRLHVYRRAPRPLSSDLVQALHETGSIVTLISSGAALEGLFRELPENLHQTLRQCPVIVPSSRVAEQAAALGCQTVVQAANAGDEAMIESLKHPAVRAGLR